MSDTSRSLRVFISYARSDAGAFAEELMAGLEAAGFDPFLDRHDIGAGEDWEKRLLSLLQQADTVVYVLSPASVHSDRCAWEVSQAEALSKRVIPVVAIDVTEAETPETLRRLNYIFFSAGHPFGSALRDLSTALRTDLAWVREHTRLGELAARWNERGKSGELLLQGSELSDAQKWLAGWKPGVPEPTPAHRAFINESDAAERARASEERKRLEDVASSQAEAAEALAEKAAAVARQRRSTWIAFWSIAALSVVMMVFGFFLLRTRSELAESRRELADKDANLADLQARLNARQESLTRAADSLTNAANAAPRDLPILLGGGRAQGHPAAAPPVSPQPPPPVTEAKRSAVEDLVRQARVDLGWDLDVFYCEGAGASENEARARTVATILNEERDRQLTNGPARTSTLSFGLGRIRVRSLSTQVNERDGYRIRGDVVQVESSEAPQGEALRRFVAEHQGPTLGQQSSATRTDYYLSVFLCAAGRKATKD